MPSVLVSSWFDKESLYERNSCRLMANRTGSTPYREMTMKFKFSTTALLALVAIVAAWFSNFLSHKKLARTQEQLRVLRELYGELDVTDPTVLHSLQLPSSAYQDEASQVWRWQVYLPADKSYMLQARYGDQVGLTGSPPSEADSRGTNLILSGEEFSDPFVLTFTARQQQNGRLLLALETQSSNDSSPAQTQVQLNGETISNASWIFESLGFSQPLARPQETRRHASGPFILLRLRKAEDSGGGWANDPDPTSGLVVWLEEWPPTHE